LGLKVGWLGCLVLGSARDFYVVEIHFDAEWYTEMANEAERFWVANILGDEPPMHDLRHPKTEELMKRLHPAVVRPSVDLPEDADEWLSSYADLKAKAEKANQDLDEVKNYFRMMVGDAGAGYLGEKKVVSYPEVTSTRIDVETLKRDYPEVAEAVTVRSSYRRLTIRPPKRKTA
jgi:predicted phage-related endonuclease